MAFSKYNSDSPSVSKSSSSSIEIDLKLGKYDLKIEIVNPEKGDIPAIDKLNGLWIVRS